MISFAVETHPGSLDPGHPLVGVVQAFADRLAGDPEFQTLASESGRAADAPSCEAAILLIGSAAFAEWSRDGSAVGCLAVASGPFFGEQDDESGFNRRLMIAVDVESSARAVTDVYLDTYDEDAAAEAWLSTVGHEAVHLADFVRASGGRTPHEVYIAGGDDADDDVLACVTLEGTEWDPCPGRTPRERAAENERRAEEVGRRLAAAAMPDVPAAAFAAMIDQRNGVSP